jgi:hypothetical protein
LLNNASAAPNAQASDAKTPQPSAHEPVDFTVLTDNAAYFVAKIIPIINTVKQPLRPAMNTVEPLHGCITFSILGKQLAFTLPRRLSGGAESQSTMSTSIPTIRPSVHCFC